MTIELVDSHHHLTDLTRSYPWLQREGPFPYHGDDTAIRRDYLVNDYLADTASVTLLGSVHVENGAADTRAEVEWIHRVIQEHGIPSAQVARADLLSADAADDLEWLAGFDSVRGIRQILNWHQDPHYSHTDRRDIITDPVWLSNFARLAPLGLSFDLQVFPDQLEQAAALARAYPETRINLDHAGMPIGRDVESVHQWRRGMCAIARETNVVVKVSAFGTNDHHWTVDSLRPFVLESIDIFGPQRAMFGSNFPVDSLYSSFDQLVDAYDEITGILNAQERRAFFVETAARVYRMDARTTINSDSQTNEETS